MDSRWDLKGHLEECQDGHTKARVLLCSGKECSMREIELGLGLTRTLGQTLQLDAILKTARTFTFSLLDSIQISLTQNYQAIILQNKISFHTKIPFYHYYIALKPTELLG